MFRASVERWRGAAQQIGNLRGIPANWILATIQSESGGYPGNPGTSGEWGLMQCMPATLATYNANNLGDQVPVSDMQGKTDFAGTQQIKVGTYEIARGARKVHNLDPISYLWPAGPLTDEQILLSDLSFSAGFGALTKHRAAAIKAGKQPDFAGMKATPGPIPLRKFGHAERALRGTRSGGTGEGIQPAPRPKPAPGGLGLLALGGLIALYFASQSHSLKKPLAKVY